jgi:hypothetical protein
MGREVVVAIAGGRLDFGPWEQIFYGKFDGISKHSISLLLTPCPIFYDGNQSMSPTILWLLVA